MAWPLMTMATRTKRINAYSIFRIVKSFVQLILLSLIKRILCKPRYRFVLVFLLLENYSFPTQMVGYFGPVFAKDQTTFVKTTSFICLSENPCYPLIVKKMRPDEVSVCEMNFRMSVLQTVCARCGSLYSCSS